MPELPEVEYAAGVARRVVAGRVLAEVRILHAAQRRALTTAAARSLAGESVSKIERRGKYQLMHLSSGRMLMVHFRMTGDWAAVSAGQPAPAHTRVLFRLDDGTALAFVDGRALGSITLHEVGTDPWPSLGHDATSDEFTASVLERAVERRRGPIKVVLLDQAVVAGVGNIYASEALWYARLDPRRSASALRPVDLRAVVRGVKRALQKSLDHPERYYGADGVSDAVRFNVYDREGKPCRRCRALIKRVVQAGRSTYWCAGCQGKGGGEEAKRRRGEVAKRRRGEEAKGEVGGRGS